jgi:hypothetical protein
MATQVREAKGGALRVRPRVHSPFSAEISVKRPHPVTLGCFDNYEAAEASVLELLAAGVAKESFSLLVGEDLPNLFGHGIFANALLERGPTKNRISAALLSIGFSPSTCVVGLINASQGGCLLVVDVPACGLSQHRVERILSAKGSTRWESLAAQ